MSFLERAKQVAGQAAKASVDVGSQAARAAGEAGGKAAGKAAATIRDPATKARARSALKKAKHGFTTALERIDPGILAEVVIKATSLQERSNTKLKERGSIYRISEITIGASIPPSIQFTIARVDDPETELVDSATLLAAAAAAKGAAEVDGKPETIVSLDGTALQDGELDELEDEE